MLPRIISAEQLRVLFSTLYWTIEFRAQYLEVHIWYFWERAKLDGLVPKAFLELYRICVQRNCAEVPHKWRSECCVLQEVGVHNVIFYIPFYLFV